MLFTNLKLEASNSDACAYEHMSICSISYLMIFSGETAKKNRKNFKIYAQTE